MQYRIGIDLGGTAIKAGVVDENNEVVFSHSQPTGEGFEQVVADMAKAAESNPAAGFSGHKAHMAFSVMPQGFVVAYTDGGIGDRLAIQHMGRTEIGADAETFLQQLLEHFQLDAAHHMHGNMPSLSNGQEVSAEGSRADSGSNVSSD